MTVKTKFTFEELLIAASKKVNELAPRLQDALVKAQHGWYPNGESSPYIKSIVNTEPTKLDSFMINDIETNWHKTTNEIIDCYPERKHILDCAFELHQKQNYIASIPLLLTQVDGICNQVLKAHFFTDKKDRIEIIEKLSQNPNNLLDIYLSLLLLPTQFNAGIREKSTAKKSLAPNRNGILHGSRHHLDYASKINSLKAFSLLAFITFTFNQAKLSNRIL